MQLNQIPNFKSASPVVNNWQFRSSANLTDSPYARVFVTPNSKSGAGNKIMLGAGALLIATAPVLAQTGSTSGSVGLFDKAVNFVINAVAMPPALFDKAVNFAINVLTMPFSIIYSYATFGNAHQRGFLLTAACIGIYVAGRRFAKNKLEHGREKWKHGIGAKFGRGTIKHISGVAAAAVTYYALAPVVSWIGKIVIDAWSKL